MFLLVTDALPADAPPIGGNSDVYGYEYDYSRGWIKPPGDFASSKQNKKLLNFRTAQTKPNADARRSQLHTRLFFEKEFTLLSRDPR